MIQKQKRISLLLLERYLAGDVSPGEQRFLERAIAEDGETAERVKKLRESDREIHNQYSPELMIKAIREKAACDEVPRAFCNEVPRANSKPVKKRRRAFPVIAPAIAVTAGVTVSVAAGIAAAFVFFIIPLLNTAPAGAPPEDRVKGNGDTPVTTELRAYLKTNPAAPAVALEDQALISAGNTIQLAYTVGSAGDRGGNRYGLIFSIDGRGAVSLHYPYRPTGTTRLTPGKQISLDEAYTLDDAPDYEIFFFVVSKAPLDVGAMLRAAETLASRRAPGDDAAFFGPYEVKTLTLRKAETAK